MTIFGIVTVLRSADSPCRLQQPRSNHSLALTFDPRKMRALHEQLTYRLALSICRKKAVSELRELGGPVVRVPIIIGMKKIACEARVREDNLQVRKKDFR